MGCIFYYAALPVGSQRLKVWMIELSLIVLYLALGGVKGKAYQGIPQSSGQADPVYQG